MALKVINLGTGENTGTGDDLRDAFKKVNDNFEELFDRPPESTTAINLGESGASVYKDLEGFELQFRKINVSGQLTIQEDDSTITISTQPGVNNITFVTGDDQITLQNESSVIGVFGDGPITTQVEDGSITIGYTGPVFLIDEEAPSLGGTLFANNNNIEDVNNLSAVTISGNLTGLVNNINVEELDNFVRSGFDFGGIIPNINGIIEWVISETIVDFGTFADPVAKNVDFGSITE